MTGEAEGTVPGTPERKDRLWTIPNLLCLLRLAGLIPVSWLAWRGERTAFLWVVAALLLTDWLDGKLAKLLHQETTIGARLDSIADAAMYGVFALCLWWLEPNTILAVRGWLMAVGITWGISYLVGLLRFRRLPSYHTLGAKASWLVGGIAFVTVVLTDQTLPLVLALALVTATNVEAVIISFVLPEWEINVRSLIHALRLRRRNETDAGEP
ncbi:MAG: CDP-alcohol phosphatidyltransferase family protein [Thermoanaerobaculia bacterium]|nr:CDP-alcohol phosphatidyltransferase family protein [Thermoanaerobaculia bacterium]